MVQNTPLTEKHIALGAKMAAFAGYNMPISYSSIKDEHFAVRKAIGVFDVSHMGEFVIRGKEALQLVQKVTSNDASKLAIGDIQYSCLPNHFGGIVDDLLVYRLPENMCSEGEQAFMLVVNASNIEKDWNWIKSQNTFDTKMINISDKTGLLAVQGPKVVEAMQPLTDINLADMKYYTFQKGTFAGVENVIVSATGYTGSGGFELYCNNEDTEKLWDAVFARGTNFDIKPAGLGARDTLRLEMGYCLYGNDINDVTSPLEAGLGWITKLNKGEFIASELLKVQKTSGLTKKLIGFIVKDRRVPRHDYVIENAAGVEIGIVTSGTQSPSLDVPIGTGYVATAEANVGNTIYIVVGEKKLAAEIVKLPFLTI